MSLWKGRNQNWPNPTCSLVDLSSQYSWSMVSQDFGIKYGYLGACIVYMHMVYNAARCWMFQQKVWNRDEMNLTLINFRGHLNESQVSTGHYFSLFKIDMPPTQKRAIALHFLDIIMCLTLCLFSHYKHFQRVQNLNMNGFVWCTLIGYLVFKIPTTSRFKEKFRIRELADPGIWDNITIKKKPWFRAFRKLLGFM